MKKTLLLTSIVASMVTMAGITGSVEGIGVNLFLVYLISHKFSFTIC